MLCQELLRVMQATNTCHPPITDMVPEIDQQSGRETRRLLFKVSQDKGGKPVARAPGAESMFNREISI